MTEMMPETGERMIPETTPTEVFWEHVSRYAFACKRVGGLSVLDIASGEGYGTKALSEVAKDVVGVDISDEAVLFARAKYHLDFRVGNAENIPADGSSFEAVVSFETVEHVGNPSEFISEVARVLKPGGLLIISTPNKAMYHVGQEPNKFHCSELTLPEFRQLLSTSFEIEGVYGQNYSGGWDLKKVELAVRRFSYRLGRTVRHGIEKLLGKPFSFHLDADSATLRREVVSRIPEFTNRINRAWNPYAVRELRDGSPKMPMYLIAVARKK